MYIMYTYVYLYCNKQIQKKLRCSRRRWSVVKKQCSMSIVNR